MNTKNMLWIIGTVTLIFFQLLRLFHLEADFPAGLTWSGVLYTDEGWYTNGAVNYFVRGMWYVEGDFNPMVNMPMGHLIQAVVFSCFSPSLLSARLTIALFFILLSVVLYFFVKRFSNTRTSVFVLVMLSTSFFIFAYSRLAILELPMVTLVLLSLFIASSFLGRFDVWIVILSSLALVAATLTKTTAIFAIPLLAYIVSRRTEVMSRKIMLSLLAMLVFIAVYGAVIGTLLYHYPEDYQYFKELNLSNRASWQATTIAHHFFHAIKSTRDIDVTMYYLTVLFCIVLVWSKEFRGLFLVRLSVLWLLGYFALLSITDYQPPRYFVPVAIPIFILFSVSSLIFFDRYGRYKRRWMLGIFVVGIVAFNQWSVVQYMLYPKYSFLDMAENVGEIVRRDDRRVHEPVLLGHFANTISLVTQLPSINSRYGTRDLEWRLDRYKPRYYISLGEERDILNTLEKKYELEPLVEYDVYDNYYSDRKVYLYGLQKKDCADGCTE